MKSILLVFCILLLFAVKGFSQQFSQYNTGTLYDSFENPSQKSFITDSSKKYAFNFLIPNFNASFFLTGDVQSTLVQRAFGGKYANSSLQIGSGKYNIGNVDANAYSVMFKMFTSLNGDVETGIFMDTKMEGKGYFTDESIALFNGAGAFANNTYDNVFNDHFYYQIYNSIGFSYREKINKQIAFGFKISALMGIDYNKLNIDESQVNFDKTNNTAAISLKGRYYQSQGPGNFDTRSFFPTFRSPGASISMGASYRTEDGLVFQGNIKDLGFIHWYDNSGTYNFNGTATAANLTGRGREDSIFKTAYGIIKTGRSPGSFNTVTDGKLELSVNKTYFLSYDKNFRYSPTLVVSKELFYDGVIGALVNRFQYKNYNVSLTGSYDNQNLFNFGTQFMIKSYNGEFYIGSDRLFQSVGLLSAKNNSAAYTNGTLTGADFFIGFSLKFGPVIEHPMDASTIPNGERGFLGRLYNRLFKTNW